MEREKILEALAQAYENTYREYQTLMALGKRGLIPLDRGNVWYTPFYFRDVWHWRRVWAQMEMMFPPEKTAPKPPEPEPIVYNATKTGQLTLF